MIFRGIVQSSVPCSGSLKAKHPNEAIEVQPSWDWYKLYRSKTHLQYTSDFLREEKSKGFQDLQVFLKNPI